MSSTPQTNFSIKGFWQRPEGKTGMVVLVATVVAGLYGASLILPWAIAFATDALHLALLCGALFAVIYTVSNKGFRNLMGNVFRLGMRWITSAVIEIDPIGILENTVDKMKENAEKLARAIEGVNGAKTEVGRRISANEAAIKKATGLKEQADKQLLSARDTLSIQRLNLSKNMELQEIGRRLKSNEKLKQIYQQTDKLYTMLGRWQNLADFNIENTVAEVTNAKEERKTILAAYRGMGFAKKLIAGDSEQMKMFNASLEYLVEDNSMKLGAMEDFARYSEKYLSTMDLEQGASADDAEKMLAQYEEKLLSSGGTQVPQQMGVAKAELVPINRSSSAIDPDYLDLK